MFLHSVALSLFFSLHFSVKRIIASKLRTKKESIYPLAGQFIEKSPM
jgi:hypothetical protein